jgi:hypothetical protein
MLGNQINFFRCWQAFTPAPAGMLLFLFFQLKNQLKRKVGYL